MVVRALQGLAPPLTRSLDCGRILESGEAWLAQATSAGEEGIMQPGGRAMHTESRPLSLAGARFLRRCAGESRGPIGAALLGAILCLLTAPLFALSLSDLSNQDAAGGLRGALNQGISTAVGKLGVPGGFLNNPKVKIPLPPALDEVAKGMRFLGRGKDADELVESMNHARS